MMQKRIFSTIALWAIAVLAIVYGASAGFTLIVCALALGANYEVCQLLRKAGFEPKLKYIQVSTVLIFVLSGVDFYRYTNLLNACALSQSGGDIVAAVSVAIVSVMALRDPYGPYFKKTVLPTAAIIVAIPFMLKWYVVVGASSGEYVDIMLAVWIIAAAKFSDVGAYVIGAAFGRHKMAPNISPNKTWEGAVGGVLSSAAIGAAISWICGIYNIFPQELTPLATTAASLFIGAAAVVSDLLESLLKRRVGVKDSGAAIPGIGGILDLADSLILCAPLAAAMKYAFVIIYLNA